MLPKANVLVEDFLKVATLAQRESLIMRGNEIGVDGLTESTVSSWIKENTDRMNIILKMGIGMPILGLLESYLHCRLQPVFEGFASQQMQLRDKKKI